MPIKNVEQQSVLSLHRVRQGFVKARTAQADLEQDTAAIRVGLPLICSKSGRSVIFVLAGCRW